MIFILHLSPAQAYPRLLRNSFLFSSRNFSGASQKKSEDKALRILFCGADDFSIASLRALHEYSRSPDQNIASIDVVTRTGKLAGRGLKQIRSPPIKPVALELGLPVHEIDTFTGWSPPEYGGSSNPHVNLVVAVSFGLLVPPRILKNCKYGGINVHPSFLPQLRGPAPIQWAILNKLDRTGITVQTLHPTRFDEGVVLDQSPPPGISIPNSTKCTYNELRDFLAPIGAQMLVNTVRSRLFVPPYPTIKWQQEDDISVESAPKITAEMSAIDFCTLTIHEILTRNRALPRLWANAAMKEKGGKEIRVIFGRRMGLATIPDLPVEVHRIMANIVPGLPYAILEENEQLRTSSAGLIVNTIDNGVLALPELQAAGSTSKPAIAAATHAHLLAEPLKVSGYTIYCFHEPLKVPKPATQTIKSKRIK